MFADADSYYLMRVCYVLGCVKIFTDIITNFTPDSSFIFVVNKTKRDPGCQISF